MDNKYKHPPQLTADNEQTETDKATNTLNKKDLEKWQKELSEREKKLNERQIELYKQELEAQNEFPKLFEEKFAVFKNHLEQREAQCESELKSIEAEKEKLRQRELTIQKAEIERDKGYADDRAKLDKELSEKQKSLNTEISEKRKVRFSDLEKEIGEECKKRLEILSDEIIKKQTDFENSIAHIKAEIEKKEAELKEREKDVENIELEKAKAIRKQERYNNELKSIEDKIAEGVKTRKQSFENEKSALNDEIARLRESIKTSSALISNFEELKQKLGDKDPAAVMLKLKTYEEEIKKLREDLTTRPTQEMQKAFDRMKSEKSALEQACSSLSDENVRLKTNAREQSKLELEISELQYENKSYKQRFESVDAENNRLMSELKRLHASYEREQDREARIRDIEAPYIQKQLPRAD
ncbi:MAG: hypothetical protein WCJ95_22100, partial [Mariniphaga sp.]